MENTVFETLKAEAEYAQGSYSTELLYQTYGRATMARKLEAISPEQFMELNEMTVVFMNTDKEYIRRKAAEFFGKELE